MVHHQTEIFQKQHNTLWAKLLKYNTNILTGMKEKHTLKKGHQQVWASLLLFL